MKATLVITFCITTSIGAFQHSTVKYQRMNRVQNNCRTNLPQYNFKNGYRVPLARQMKSASASAENDVITKKPERRRTSLSASTLEYVAPMDEALLPFRRISVPSSDIMGSVSKVLSASLLVTGNTVGSSMFVLPDTVGTVGMAWGSAIFIGLYLYNLVSGLMLADVAINLHESSDCDVPSSFKDFADCAMKDETAGNVIGAASLLMNSCFLAYGLVTAGSFVSQILPGIGLDPTMSLAFYSAILSLAFCTQNNEGIEKIANSAVMVLFSSFAVLLLPSLANVHDPIGTFLAPGTQTEGFSAAISTAIPLVLSTLIYQNIVPSITKLLDFDKTKTYIAVALGSFIPMGMYVAWCFAVLGGGLDDSLSSGVGSAMFNAFTASSLVGSSIGCIMSLVEEYESIIASASPEEFPCSTPTGSFSVPAVAMSVLPPAAVAALVSSGGDGAFIGPLHLSGAVITPFLYGIIPLILFGSMQSDNKPDDLTFDKIPQALLGACTVGILGHEMIQDFSNWFA